MDPEGARQDLDRLVVGEVALVARVSVGGDVVPSREGRRALAPS